MKTLIKKHAPFAIAYIILFIIIPLYSFFLDGYSGKGFWAMMLAIVNPVITLGISMAYIRRCGWKWINFLWIFLGVGISGLYVGMGFDVTIFYTAFYWAFAALGMAIGMLLQKMDERKK